MRAWRNALLGFACGLLLWSFGSANAQQPDSQTKTGVNALSDAPDAGKALVAGKCFQCHTDAMFRDGRQDRRAWEATIYRMVGRGALWTPDEIKSMAAYLGDALGPDVKPAAPAK
jgi:mono/diheme cytochrome c family protein